MKPAPPGVTAKEPTAQPGRPTGDEGPTLWPGRAVKATVLQAAANGRVVVRIAGQALVAESDLPLRPGQNLELIVEQASPRLVLALADRQPVAPSDARRAMGELLAGSQRLARQLETLLKIDFTARPLADKDTQKAAVGLQEAARAVIIDRQKAAEPALIRQSLAALAAKGGLSREANLAKARPEALVGDDLRSMAQRFLARLPLVSDQIAQQDPERAAELGRFAEAAKGLATTLEANQRLNAQILPEQSLLVLLLPLVLGGPADQGQLLLEPPPGDENERRQRPTRLAFFLRLEALGPVVVEALAQPGAVQADFLLDSEPKAAMVRGMLPQLAQALEAAGFTAQLAATARPADDLEAQAPLARLIGREGQYLSVTV